MSLFKTTHRDYTDSLIFSHILGYEGKIRSDELSDHPDYLMTDSIGKQGVERSYEAELRGKRGFRRVEDSVAVRRMRPPSWSRWTGFGAPIWAGNGLRALACASGPMFQSSSTVRTPGRRG